MAERQGFEPWEGVTPQRFSRPPLSAAQPSLLNDNIIFPPETNNVAKSRDNVQLFTHTIKEGIPTQKAISSNGSAHILWDFSQIARKNTRFKRLYDIKPNKNQKISIKTLKYVIMSLYK